VWIVAENNYSSIDRRKDLLEQLNRHLDWIKSCDTKSSIVLAVIGIFLTIFATNNSINLLNTILLKAIGNINFANILYLLTFFISLCSFIYGAYCLIRVLTPILGKKVQEYQGIHTDSLYFFETIARNSFFEFKDKVNRRSEEDEISDILSQIYINAKICTIKYSFYSKGIKLSFLGIASVLILYVIGVILLNVEAINQHRIDLKRIKQPILDEQEIQEISRKLGKSITEYVPISISLYRRGFIEEMNGIVQKIDPRSREIKLTDYEHERHKIIFDNIVNVDVH
jgi:hypothetical protein